jgi:hypothetical protein
VDTLAARSIDTASVVERAASKVLDVAVETIGPTSHGSISVVDTRGLRTLATTDDVARQLDVLQVELGQGPLASTAIGPEFRSQAAASGVHSVLAVPFPWSDGSTSALSLYAAEPDAFTVAAQHIADTLASHAGLVLAMALRSLLDGEKIGQLEEAIRSRDIIGQAKGILMEREHCTPDESFDMLRRASQKLNIKLRQVAAALVENTATRALEGRR